MTDKDTIAVYEAKAKVYEALPQDTDEDREAFVTALPRGNGPILDWGCGPGHDAASFASAGLTVEATDATDAMVSLALAKGVAARREVFEDLQPLPRFRGIWANFSLLHADPDDLPGLALRAGKALLPGGVMHIGMKQGQGSERDSIGRRYVYVEAADLDRMTAAAGLERISLRHGRGTGLSGDVADFLIHLSHKSDA